MAIRFLGLRTGGMGSSNVRAGDADAPDIRSASPGSSLPDEQPASTTTIASPARWARITSQLPRAQVNDARSLSCTPPTGLSGSTVLVIGGKKAFRDRAR